MRNCYGPAVVSMVFALPLLAGCSRPPSSGAETAGGGAAAPAPQAANEAAGPAAQVSIPLSVAHSSAAAQAHGKAADASMPAQPIAQPAGGTSVAEVWANRAALAGKSVTVRGKVVKVNAGIMNRNWVHLQDGTGKPDDGTHDLTFTTSDMAKVGDVVTATGTVAVDKDFTAGYKYGVIVEDARLK